MKAEHHLFKGQGIATGICLCLSLQPESLVVLPIVFFFLIENVSFFMFLF